jgi:betaine lipid synthase
VDLNPCQNHLLELKLSGITSLVYEDFWKLFGEGYIPNFKTMLDTHLSPNLSPYAYDFWKKTGDFKNLFKTGCSGLAIRVFSFVIKLRRLQPIVERMCHAETIQEQEKIWIEELRPHILNKWLIRILNNDRFLWGALGVPPAQMQMLLEEGLILFYIGSAHEYCVNTFDPVIGSSLLRDDNYFFYMPLMLKYNQKATGNPAYLTQSGFDTLVREPHRLDAIKIHTDYIINVLNNQVEDGELTKVILMDHLDWFSVEDATAEISAVHKKMKKGGYVFWRSAGKAPWYNDLFEKLGFRLQRLQVREGETMFIDRVNMYASFWRGVKL